jgi:uncharacterized phage protein (TIGR02220 family)
MNGAKELLKKFTTKKDALNAVKFADDILLNLYTQAKLKSLMPFDGTRSLFYDASEILKALYKSIENYDDTDLSQKVLEFLNEQYGTQYKNADKIKSIIRSLPKVTFDQFASIIVHKKETWGTDPKMKEYLRPATLFGSKNKFETYLEDATHYWIKKQKHDSQRKI